MNVKYQVFISSTYEDLRTEREQVVKAVLEMGHIPVGMEMFNAADETQWKVIERQIDECDYYAVIVAHKYGSMVDGVSYTEKEYDYAVLKGVPVLGFVIDSGASWPGDQIEGDNDKKASLEDFKKKVKLKMVSVWNSADDLYGKFFASLTKQISATPRVGWARASDVVGPQVTIELSRLSSENAALRLQLSESEKKAEEDAAIERKKIIETLSKNGGALRLGYVGVKGWSDGPKVTLFEIFNSLGSELINETSLSNAAYLLGIYYKEKEKGDLRQTWPVPNNVMKDYFADFTSLGLTKPSAQKHSLKDKKEYWTLTEKGRELLAYLRRLVLEMGEISKEGDGSEEETGQAT